MHIFREPVTIEQQVSSFGKHLSLIRTFIQEYCEVSNMKLNIWLDISSEYIEDFIATASVAVGLFSEKLTDTPCKDFSLTWFLAFL